MSSHHFSYAHFQTQPDLTRTSVQSVTLTDSALYPSYTNHVAKASFLEGKYSCGLLPLRTPTDLTTSLVAAVVMSTEKCKAKVITEAKAQHGFPALFSGVAIAIIVRSTIDLFQTKAGLGTTSQSFMATKPI
jgi:hypothetical protein